MEKFQNRIWSFLDHYLWTGLCHCYNAETHSFPAMFNTWGPKKIERGQKQKLQYQFFFETDTDTFIGTKFFRNWYWYFFRYQRFFKPIPILFPIPKYFETDTIKNGKVSKLRSFETEMSHSANNQNNHWNTEWQLQSYLTCFQYEQPGQVFLLQLITPLPPARIVTVSIIHVIFVVVHLLSSPSQNLKQRYCLLLMAV